MKWPSLLPRLGQAGSRSAWLHEDDPNLSQVGSSELGSGATDGTGAGDSSDSLKSGVTVGYLGQQAAGIDLLPVHTGTFPLVTQTAREEVAQPLTPLETSHFGLIRWLGTIGAVLASFGALGGGALPVIDNPYHIMPGGNFLSRMMHTSSVMVLVGVGFLVLAWLLMAPFMGIGLHKQRPARLSMSMMRRTFIAWVAPFVLTAPLFTQDIYSYLAQGEVVRRGLDPYSAGPIDLLGVDNLLARSVPFIWAHSPSPYGPVALATAAVIAWISGGSIVVGVLLHRIVSIIGVAAAGWALTQLARRHRVYPQVAVWLGIINPLTILHLVGGIHNEAIEMGLMLVGIVLALKGIDRIKIELIRSGTLWLIAGSALIVCAGLVKVTAFIALGFVGMALARALHGREMHPVLAVGLAALFETVILLGTIALVTAITGINLGWITGQGGAATIRSWMSITTDTAIVGGWLGQYLQLGDHTEAMLIVTRAVGLVISGIFCVRMLLATFRGTISPLGGLGVSTFVLVVLFPVVHPWYMLWAIIPLAAWANRTAFRLAVIGYSSIMCFFVLPRGLRLSAISVGYIYLKSAFLFAISLIVGIWLLRRLGILGKYS